MTGPFERMVEASLTEFDDSVLRSVRLRTGRINADHKNILLSVGLGTASGTMIQRGLKGLKRNRGAYYTVTLPANELIGAGLLEIAGYDRPRKGIGFSYAGPGSSSATKMDKQDPALARYRLTPKGRELYKRWTGEEEKPEPPRSRNLSMMLPQSGAVNTNWQKLKSTGISKNWKWRLARRNPGRLRTPARS